LGYIKPELLFDLLYLIVFCCIFFPLALIRMHRRLIK
jgi:hypothetical protein